MILESPRQIAYIRGIKYQLRRDYSVMTPIKGVTIVHDFFVLRVDGLLTIRRGYAWDGASGPVFNTPSSRRGTLVHDALCQAMRAGLLPVEWQASVHEFMRVVFVQDGMWAWRASVWHWFVVRANGGHPDKGPDRPLQYAPDPDPLPETWRPPRGEIDRLDV